MIYRIHIPALGANMEKAKITAWLVSDGDEVKEGENVATIETDKTSYEISAPGSGIIRVIQPLGAEVPVGGVIGMIVSTREEYEKIGVENFFVAQPKTDRPAPPSVPVPEPEQRIDSLPTFVKISAIARKIATNHGLDLSKLRGTGPGGRITKEDVEKHLAEKTVQAPSAIVPPVVPAGPKVKSMIPLSGKKKVMAKRLQESMQVMAQMTNWEFVDMIQLIQMKESGLMDSDGSDSGITYNDIFVKFTGLALQEYPLLNSTLRADQIIIWDDINIGVAVAMGEEGDDLVVPVVRSVERKSIREIGKELRALVKKAREDSLSLDELTGGTISITNIGAFGANPGTPIIQLPQSAIVGFGAIERKPVVVNDEIVIRPVMLLAVTVDHRFITGAISARFRKRLKYLLENPMIPIFDCK